MSAVVLSGAVALGGCGTDVEMDAPILNAVGINLASKKKDESDLPERPGIVVPPSTASLPQPGERTGTAGENWPVDPDQQKKSEAEAKAAAREKYCAEGDWKGKGGITEYEKDTGRQARCPSKLGESITKQFGGRPDAQ